METPIAVANYFVEKSLNTGEELTPMKLVKLVYIAHGWHLGLSKEPLISEAVQAWKYGPVVVSVYNAFRRYGSGQINSLESTAYHIDGKFGFKIDNVSDDIKPFLDKIWNVYGKYNGVQLSSLTHQPKTPWDIVWNSKGGSKELAAIIPNEIIKEHYISKSLNGN